MPEDLGVSISVCRGRIGWLDAELLAPVGEDMGKGRGGARRVGIWAESRLQARRRGGHELGRRGHASDLGTIARWRRRSAKRAAREEGST